MIASSPERTIPSETPAPEAEATECHTPEEILQLVRDSASRLDARHTALYRGVDAQRVMLAADLLAQLLVAHSTYLEANRFGGGRRTHSARVYALLDSANMAELVIALAWVHAAYTMLPGPVPNRNERSR